VSDNLVEVRDLVKHFPITRGVILQRGIASVRAVDGISFDVRRGESFGIVGETGCGKTTTARLVMRLLDATAGTIAFDGTNVTSLRGRALRPLRREVQMVFQDPYSSLNPRKTAGSIIAEPFVIHGLEPGARRRSAVQRPKLVIADEPVSALDVSIQAQVLNLLRDLQRELGLTLIFIAHDLSVVRYMCDRVAVMYLGKLVEVASSDELFAHPRHPYTGALLSALPVLDPE